MVFQKFILQALIILSIIGIPFISASPVSTIIKLETKTVIEVVSVTVFIPFQTSPPLVDIYQQQQLTAPNIQNGTKSAQSFPDIPANAPSAQNFQYNTQTPEKPTAQDDTINILSSPSEPEAGIAQFDSATKSNNKTIDEFPKNAVTPPPNEILKAQEVAPVTLEVPEDEEVEAEAEEVRDEAEESPKIPPVVPEIPKAREPAAKVPELSDEDEAIQKPSPPPPVPEVPVAQDPPKTEEISTPQKSAGANGNSPSQANPVLINSPTTPDTPKAQKPQKSRESGDTQDDSPKRVPQEDEKSSKFLSALSNYESTALKFHNLHRINHTSSELSWNSTLAKFALETAKTCVFEHDFSPGDGNYGQNLAVFGSSLGVKSLDKSDLLADSITNKWYNTEYRNVPFGLARPPISGPQFLHLTQVIWKDTRTVGCATYECPRGTIFSFSSLYTVCDYFPPGNVLGQFDTKINRALGEGTVVTTAFD